MASRYDAVYQHSITDPEAFWSQQAERIHWDRPFDAVLDRSRPPFTSWFKGGLTNLCYNAVDRHLAERGDQPALVWESTEVDSTRIFTYSELHAEVNRVAAIFKHLGIARGDRVLIYMPMIPEAVFAMLACTRIGATHSVVFGGFAAGSLAKRIDDAKPRLIVSADAGMRGGRVIPYKPLLDAALAEARAASPQVLLVNRGLTEDLPWNDGRDLDYATLAQQFENVHIPVEWVDSAHPSYVLYTSGTTGLPKGIQRDTGGHAVALATSMELVYGTRPGETMLTTSDIGWVVGHSYIVYGPLLTGVTTILYEGLPIRPDAGIWWRLVEKYGVQTMFSSPTAFRVLRKQGEEPIRTADTGSLRNLFLAGEPLDESTHRWAIETLRTEVIDHYWQTETGWPILANCAGLGLAPTRHGSPAFPVYGYDLAIVDDDLAPLSSDTKGKLVCRWPLPPGCLSTVWGDDARFVSQYFVRHGDDWLYTSGDYAVRDADGYYYLLGRDDDVINVAGHRLGTREIEETLCAADGVAEAAVIGPREELKGQAVVAFVVMRAPDDDPTALERRLQHFVDQKLGAIARPTRVYPVAALPKTRSGKIMRRALLALVEGQELGDLSTIEDASAIEGIRNAIRRG